MEPHTMTAVEIAGQVASHKLSPTETVSSALSRISRLDPDIKAFLTLCEHDALASAKRLEEKLAKGEKPGILAGVPIAVKDNLCTKGVRTTCGSKMLSNYIPPYDATVVQKILAQDAIVIGKTNMDEFAMGSSCENSAYFPTKNPVDLSRAPGGSSGGSAAAVAAGMVPLAFGSDTGGSIRQPAAFCGTVGLKPTYGLVSRYGLIAFASSLDQVGPISRTVKDSALFLNAIAGRDEMDSTSVEGKKADYLDGIDGGVKGLKIGIPKEYFGKGVDKDVTDSVMAAAKTLEKSGAILVEVSLPHTEYGIPAYYIIAPAEASSNLARYDGVKYGHRSADSATLERMFANTRTEGFGPEVKRRIMLGTFVLSSGYYDAYYNKALKVRRLIKNDFDGAFKQADILLSPTAPQTAFKLGEKTGDPLAMYMSDALTVCANLAGLPGISVPCAPSKQGLPIGLQLIGRPFAEALILRAARTHESNNAKG